MVYFNKKKEDSRGRDYILVTNRESVEYTEFLGKMVGITVQGLKFGTIYPQANELNLLDMRRDDEIANYIISDRPVVGIPNLFETERCVD